MLFVSWMLSVPHTGDTATPRSSGVTAPSAATSTSETGAPPAETGTDTGGPTPATAHTGYGKDQIVGCYCQGTRTGPAGIGWVLPAVVAWRRRAVRVPPRPSEVDQEPSSTSPTVRR
jgi:hypothetical protein